MESLIAKLRYYEEHTWSGSPAVATPELGEVFLDLLAEHGAEGLSRVIKGEIGPLEAHSPVWKLRWVFSSVWLSDLFEWAVGYRNRVW